MMEHINRLERIFTEAGIKFTRVQNPKSFEWYMCLTHFMCQGKAD